MEADGSIAKRARLGKLVGIRYVTDSALSEILKALKADGLLVLDVTGTSRRNLKKHAEPLVNTTTVYGQIIRSIKLPLQSGGTWDWDVPHPAAYINLCAQTESFGRVLTH